MCKFQNLKLTATTAPVLLRSRWRMLSPTAAGSKGEDNVQIYLSIDDTDNLDSPGSGQLAEMLSGELRQAKLSLTCSNISRHQLFVHDTIPYTSHNSSMCFSSVINDHRLDDIIQFAQQFLRKASAPGSDPGLCVAAVHHNSDYHNLTTFGQRAKKTRLTKQEAYFLADRAGVHLSEHGGTGDGIIGALAGTGLRLNGNDGRFRGWLDLGPAGSVTNVKALTAHPFIDAVIANDGQALPTDVRIRLGDDRVKTVLQNHLQVVPVRPCDHCDEASWSTLTKAEVKRF